MDEFVLLHIHLNFSTIHVGHVFCLWVEMKFVKILFTFHTTQLRMMKYQLHCINCKAALFVLKRYQIMNIEASVRGIVRILFPLTSHPKIQKKKVLYPHHTHWDFGHFPVRLSNEDSQISLVSDPVMMILIYCMLSRWIWKMLIMGAFQNTQLTTTSGNTN